jgi:hypothetical protein
MSMDASTPPPPPPRPRSPRLKYTQFYTLYIYTCFRRDRLTNRWRSYSSVFGKFYPHTLNYFQPHMVEDTLSKTATGEGLLCTLAAQSSLAAHLPRWRLVRQSGTASALPHSSTCDHYQLAAHCSSNSSMGVKGTSFRQPCSLRHSYSQAANKSFCVVPYVSSNPRPSLHWV